MFQAQVLFFFDREGGLGSSFPLISYTSVHGQMLSAPGMQVKAFSHSFPSSLSVAFLRLEIRKED